MAGRPRKPTAELKLLGTFREDRQGGRADASFPSSVPPMPSDLGPDGEWLWTTIVDGYPPGGLATQDASAMEGAARWWARYRKFDRVSEETGDYKATCLASIAWKAFVTIATKLGLSPSARAALKLPSDQQPQGKLGKYVR